MPVLPAARSLLRWRAASLAVAALGAIAACERDSITGPEMARKDVPLALHFNADPAPLPPPMGSQVPHGITRTFETSNSDGSITWQELGKVRRPLVGRMTIRQKAWQNGPDRGYLEAGPQGIYVPGFYDNFCALKAAMGYRYVGGGGWTDDWRPHGPNCPNPASEEEVNPNFTWLADSAGIYGNRGSGSYELCGRGCHKYGGYTTFMFTPTSNVVTLTASPTSVLEGSEVRFTARRTDVLLTSVYGWIWKPADTTQTPQTVACAGTDTTCTTRVFEDGWMFVQVVIGGYLHTAHAGVRVKRARLVVTASDSTPAYGESVTYTAVPEPREVTEFAIKGWSFIPADTTVAPTPLACQDTTCTIRAQAPGTVRALATMARRTDSASVHVAPSNVFELTANKLAVYAGDTVKFTPFLNGDVVPAERWLWRSGVGDSTDVAGCADNTQPCEKVMRAAGTMWAFTTYPSGQVDSARVDIDVAVLCSGLPGGLSGASSSGTLRTTTRSVSTAAAPPMSASSACQPGGDPGGTYKQLRVISYGGVKGKPLPSDSVLVVAFKTGAMVSYEYGALDRHVDLAVVVDDTGRAAAGTLKMDRDHTIEVAADFDWANDPEVLALRARYHNLLRAGNKVEAFRQQVEWFANSSRTAVRDPDSLDLKLTIARIIEFDYGLYGPLILALDDALRGHAFRLSPGSGPKTVTIWSGLGGEGASATKVQANAAPTAAAAPAPPPGAVIFVNGIWTAQESAEQMVVTMDQLMTAEPGLTGVPAWLFWNRSAEAQVEAYARDNGCAGRFLSWDVVKKPLTQGVRYAACKKWPLFVRQLYENDLAEGVRQFLSITYRAPFKTPEDAPLLARFAVDQHELGIHTIFTLHSQGNLLLSQALPLISSTTQSRQARSKCTAAVSLASPIGMNSFMADTGLYLRGMTVGDIATQNMNVSLTAGDDILLRFDNRNYGTHRFKRTTSSVREAGLLRLKQPGSSLELKGIQGWSLSKNVHFVGPNYFRDGFNSREIANWLVGLWDTCKAKRK